MKLSRSAVKEINRFLTFCEERNLYGWVGLAPGGEFRAGVIVGAKKDTPGLALRAWDFCPDVAIGFGNGLYRHEMSIYPKQADVIEMAVKERAGESLEAALADLAGYELND